MRRAIAVSGLLLVIAGCEPRADSVRRRLDGGLDDSGLNEGGVNIGPDADGDGIADVVEGSVDTDNDGTPDREDTDSDNDGIPDSIERGRGAPGTVADTDADSTPDFRDLDSDANGVSDQVEGAEDPDSDYDPNFRDSDNDGDLLPDLVELAGMPATPLDSDADSTPDYLDVDSDNDTISDREESTRDTDQDEMLDRFEADSDNDTLSDAEEAGDADVNTPARDLDGDETPDYRDPDADGDGLSDRDEAVRGINPFAADTDGDGVSDLIEIGACPMGDSSCAHDATTAGSSPRTRGDFVFVVPYNEAPTPDRDTLEFSTTLQRADVYFLMDNTGSMRNTIEALQDGLRDHVIPDTLDIIPEAWFGVGGFDDYPLGPSGSVAYGAAGAGTDSLGIVHDVPFFQYATMTNDVDVLQAAVDVYRVNSGSDGPESGVAALFALMTRNTLGGYARFPSPTPPTCPMGRTGGAACFRNDAVPIVVVMTDVDQHNSPTCSGCAYSSMVVTGGGPSYASTITALEELNARVVGIATSNGARNFLQRLVTDTTIARGATGAASDYVINAPSGSGLTSAVATAIQRAAVVPLDVSARVVDLVDGSETVDAVSAFIEAIETNNEGAPVGSGRTCTTGFVVEDRDDIDADSLPDTFNDVTPGAPVCFDIRPKMNTTVPAVSTPQLFRARVNVIGDGFTPLDDREIYFLVPPAPPEVTIPG